jgi:pimeloyl-ACP methyl ester carboxylesterase
VLTALGISEPVIFGWSLGGHIGIEMTHLVDDARGLVITGTPPSGPGQEEVMRAFSAIPELSFTGAETFTPDQAGTYARFVYGHGVRVPEAFDALVRRCDGRSRATMFGDFLSDSSRTHPQIATVGTWPRPLAVLQGTDDPFMDIGYFDTLSYGNLWRGTVHRFERAGHAPFWERAAEYNMLLEAFMDDLARR